jgi:hypothetical protein
VRKDPQGEEIDRVFDELPVIRGGEVIDVAEVGLEEELFAGGAEEADLVGHESAEGVTAADGQQRAGEGAEVGDGPRPVADPLCGRGGGLEPPPSYLK